MPCPIIILGPTAGGKSTLAHRLALHLAGEIVSADSMQIYQHLDAGTAKPTPADRRELPYHLVDHVQPTQRFTVRDWLLAAHHVIADINARQKTPIIVGGTNLYLNALIHGLVLTPPPDPTLRARLDAMTTAELHARLTQIDPAAAARIALPDRRRAIRALEVHQLTGQTLSDQQTQWPAASNEHPPPQTPPPDSLPPLAPSPILIGLHYPPDVINPRINRRVKAMFYPHKVEPELAAQVCFNGESLPQEVDRLLADNILTPAAVQAREALGYKQVLACREASDDRLRTLDDAYERTKILTRRFAKQQRTWLKRFTGVHWLEPTNAAITDEILQQTLRLIKTPLAADPV